MGATQNYQVRTPKTGTNFTVPSRQTNTHKRGEHAQNTKPLSLYNSLEDSRLFLKMSSSSSKYRTYTMMPIMKISPTHWYI